MKKFEFLPVKEHGIFTEDGYYVWCGSMFRYREKYYLAYSRWERKYGFETWVIHSEIALACADSPFGEFHYVKTIRGKRDTDAWDRDCAHNPIVIEDNGTYYLYYMGNYGSGEFWDHRNHQRIGVAFTDDPTGEWTFFDTPVLDVSETGFDSLMVSNPTVTKTPDGRFLMIYKGVENNGNLPWGGSVVCGAAIADTPTGPFRKYGKPIFVNPENGWSVEDPFVFFRDGKFRAIVKDFQGYFTGTKKTSLALFCSDDGYTWQPDEAPLFSDLSYPTEEGRKQVYRLERPAIYFENGKPVCFLAACAEEKEMEHVYNIRIPLS